MKSAIKYLQSPDGITIDQLEGFFVGWPTPPSREAHLALLHRSTHVVLALDTQHYRLVGFATAMSDGVLFAGISLLEVLPVYQGKGIGTRIMEQMLGQLGSQYIIDLQCDLDVQPFYQRLGMDRSSGMRIRRYEKIPSVA